MNKWIERLLNLHPVGLRPVGLFLVGLLVAAFFAAAAFYLLPHRSVETVYTPGYTITTDNQTTRSGEQVTCFVLRVDGEPVDLSCVSDAPPLQFVPWDGPAVEPEAEPGASW